MGPGKQGELGPAERLFHAHGGGVHHLHLQHRPRTSVIYRWLAHLGLPIALVLLIAEGSVPYIALLSPLWILLVSLDVLVNILREGRAGGEAEAAAEDG